MKRVKQASSPGILRRLCLEAPPDPGGAEWQQNCEGHAGGAGEGSEVWGAAHYSASEGRCLGGVVAFGVFGINVRWLRWKVVWRLECATPVLPT